MATLERCSATCTVAEHHPRCTLIQGHAGEHYAIIDDPRHKDYVYHVHWKNIDVRKEQRTHDGVD